MQRLAEAERTQTALSNTTMAKMNSGATATESEILFFRNQLKVSSLYNKYIKTKMDNNVNLTKWSVHPRPA